MATESWGQSKRLVSALHLDSKNPRIGREITARAPRDIIQYLFEHDKALEVAQSIATRGYFPNEPLLAIKEDGRLVVVEGNRRLAALKALREPALLEGSLRRQVERLAKQIEDPKSIANVPVTLAPSRRSTDRQISGRHVGTQVLAWQAENRASFILDKLSEGYTNDQLRDQLGFSLADIQSARQTRAIADMARSLELPDELKAKLSKPRTNVFSTIERVFDSTSGREYLRVEPDAEHGLRGTTAKSEFLKGFTKLVTDVILEKQSSRSLNKKEDIEKYFESWKKEDLPAKKRGSFVPSDIIKGRSIASADRAAEKTERPKKQAAIFATVVPKNLKVVYGNARLIDMRNELTKLKREDYPNAGAVMLRVFFELVVTDYLNRIGEYSKIVARIEAKEGRRLPYGALTMKQLVPEINKIASKYLSKLEAQRVEKALRYDAAAPFTISELHGFVHHTDLPNARDILQFWTRVEPVVRVMLERDDAQGVIK